MPTDNLNNERELLQKVAEGDEAAFRRLIKDYSGLLYNFLNSHLKNHESAQEIMQDIFIQVWQTRESLPTIRNFRTFLFVLSRNYAINEINKLIRKKANEKNYLKEQTETFTELSDPDPRSDLLEEAINHLPKQQKTAWTLSRREGLKYSEIATEMNISRDTVKKHIHTATLSIIDYIKGKDPTLLALVIFSLLEK